MRHPPAPWLRRASGLPRQQQSPFQGPIFTRRYGGAHTLPRSLFRERFVTASLDQSVLMIVQRTVDYANATLVHCQAWCPQMPKPLHLGWRRGFKRTASRDRSKRRFLRPTSSKLFHQSQIDDVRKVRGAAARQHGDVGDGRFPIGKNLLQ